MSRPSDGFTFDELRDEFDWMFEFQSRMAERIRDDADVHNLADYMTKLETENAKLHWNIISLEAALEGMHLIRNQDRDENDKLRELVRDMWQFEQMSCNKCVAKNDGYCGIGIDEGCPLEHSIYDRMRELGVEVDEWAITTTDFCPSRACDSTSGSASSTHQSSLETARGT